MTKPIKNLGKAVKATFDNRKLAYNPNLQLFNDDFCTDEVRLKRWEVFLKKIRWKGVTFVCQCNDRDYCAVERSV